MKVEGVTNNPTAKAAVLAEGATGNTAVKNDFLADSQNEEFILFREAGGKTWAFPRAHLVHSKMKAKLVCEFNFRTHLVTFGGVDCTEIYRALLDVRVCAVVADEWKSPPLHVRPVVWVKVSPCDPELEGRKS